MFAALLLSFLGALLHSSAGLPQREFTCPELDGTYEDPLQCDKYWICTGGSPRSILCKDGLVFAPAKALHSDPCDSPYVVDCGSRVELQEASFPNEFCPRLNGIFADPDPAICNVFHTCINGAYTQTTCSTGLHFDEVTGNCAWPDVVNRQGCLAKPKASINGFTCPGEEKTNDQGITIPHPTYPDLEDCQKFYVCLNGVTPQEASCSSGKVYNERTMTCDLPENVPECADWQTSDYYYENTAPAANPKDELGGADYTL